MWKAIIAKATDKGDAETNKTVTISANAVSGIEFNSQTGGIVIQYGRRDAVLYEGRETRESVQHGLNVYVKLLQWLKSDNEGIFADVIQKKKRKG